MRVQGWQHNRPFSLSLSVASCLDSPSPLRGIKLCPWATLPYLTCFETVLLEGVAIRSPPSKAALSYNSTVSGCDKPWQIFQAEDSYIWTFTESFLFLGQQFLLRGGNREEGGCSDQCWPSLSLANLTALFPVVRKESQSCDI